MWAVLVGRVLEMPKWSTQPWEKNILYFWPRQGPGNCSGKRFVWVCQGWWTEVSTSLRVSFQRVQATWDFFLWNKNLYNILKLKSNSFNIVCERKRQPSSLSAGYVHWAWSTSPELKGHQQILHSFPTSLQSTPGIPRPQGRLSSAPKLIKVHLGQPAHSWIPSLLAAKSSSPGTNQLWHHHCGV